MSSQLKASQIEADLQRELMGCPECGKDVFTTAAEGIPAQALRACRKCGATFFMDLESTPRQVEGEGV